MQITEERLFNCRGQWLATTHTPEVTDVRKRLAALHGRIESSRFLRRDPWGRNTQRGMSILLKNGLILVLIFGRQAEAMAATTTPAQTWAAD